MSFGQFESENGQQKGAGELHQERAWTRKMLNERNAQPEKERDTGETLLRRRLDRLGWLLLVLFVFAAAEDLLENVLLLFLLGVLSRVGSVSVRWRVGGLADNRSTRCGGWWCCVGGGGFVSANAEDLLDEVLRVLSHLAAAVDGCGAVEEGNVETVAGAAGVDQEAGGLIDMGGGDALGRDEGLNVGVLGKQNRALHELRPYWSRSVGAFDLDVGVVVVANPYDADEVRGIAGEPGVVAGSGFTGCRGGEAVSANRIGGRAVVYCAF